ncbi:MAG: glycosyl hydrolase [Clostridia bacterium]|nr:glycosyl hydrolase [Clostridia bacterium]
MRTWQIDLIHHSHTDIGYTDRQENIRLQHEGFLRQAVGILKQAESGAEPRYEGFRWQCENFWQVENFLAFAAEEEKADLIRFIREGKIGLSGSYLNLTELVDERTLSEALERAAEWGRSAGRPIRSAMTADINGYAWGTPDLMARAGMENLFCALHTHHGMFPQYRNPSFFLWEGPAGGRVLTFVGEHYHWGNVLGFCPNGNSSFMIHDEFHTGMDDGTLLRTSAERTEEEELALASARITRYLQGLEDAAYPLSTVPLMVSGIISDNGPPNGRIAERVTKLNRLLGPAVRIRMAVLDDFFQDLRAEAGQIPVCRGDFTDWWADGVGSAPAAVSLYRAAQRSARLTEKLDPDGSETDRAALEKARRALMLYAEHTWSYSSSVYRPWEPQVNTVSSRKAAFAAEADSAACRALNSVLLSRGMKTLSAEGTQNYRVVNPHGFRVSLPVEITLANWEYVKGCYVDRDRPLALRNRRTGELLTCQNRWGSRGLVIETVMTLDAGEAAEVEICAGPDPERKLDHVPRIGADGVTDIEGAPDSVLPSLIRTDFLELRASAEQGVFSLRDLRTGAELLSDVPPCGAFGAAYDVTAPAGQSQTAARRSMGRKRVSVNTKRGFSRVRSLTLEENGPVYTVLKLSWELPGCPLLETRLKLYRHHPLLQADVRLHKQSTQDYESLYVALPFRAAGDTRIDKTGCILRPGIDQLPGTCGEFWLLQSGAVRDNGKGSTVIAVRDTPLITLGLPEAGPVRLCAGNDAEKNRAPLWSWVMNNFWETNFNVCLAGHYEFRYTVSLTDSGDPAETFALCGALNEGFAVFRV